MITRVGMAGLGGLYLIGGVWALAAPGHFYARFPGLDQHWTAAYPPYNEHLIADLGATFTTLAVLLSIAAVLDDRRVTVVVLAGVTVFSAIHLAYHAVRHGTLAAGPLVASLISLTLGVLAPVFLIFLTSRRGRATRMRRC